MFNYISKSCLFVGLRASHSPSTYEFQRCLPFLSMRSCLFSTPGPGPSKDQSLTASYLINTYGLSPKSAIRASKMLQLQTPDRVAKLISFLDKYGFSQTHTLKMITRCPRLVSHDQEKTLLPRMVFFYSIGFSRQDLVNLLSLCPFLFRRSLKGYLIPNFSYLSNLLGSREKAIHVIKSKPYLLYNDLQTSWAHQVEILLEYGLTASNIVMSMVTYSYSRVKDKKVFREVVEEVKEMGFQTSKHFVMAVSIKSGLSRSLWESKVNEYKKWGWSEEEFVATFRKNPRIMMVSKDNIRATMDFFVNKMGIESSFVAKYPILLLFSLQKRIIPRATVFQFLMAEGLIKPEHGSLHAWNNCSEKSFLKRYLNSYDEAPWLLQLYKDKLSTAESLEIGLSTLKRERKLNMFKKWGWSEEEFLEVFRKVPRLMDLSEDRLMASMAFFVNKMGLKSSDIARDPGILLHSLQKRIIPRAAVFQYLVTKGLIKHKFTTLLKFSEENFQEMIVKSYGEAPKLLELYKDKLVLLKITN